MMKIENIIRRVLREQEEEKLSELPPIDDFFDNDWNLVLNFMNRYRNKKFYYPSDLDLTFSDIETLGNLVKVEGDLNLRKCQNFQSLGNLEYVGGNLNLRYTKIETLENLEYVGGGLNLIDTDIETLGNLEYVGDALDLFGCENLKSLGNLEYVGGYLDLSSTPLEKKYTEEEIRKMIEVDGEVYL
jgi:hypothetical protein